MAEVLSGLFGGGGAGAASTGANLGVNTTIAQPTIPTSVIPLSQQIANMQQPTLTNPMDVAKKGPSLGVDTSIKLPQQGQSISLFDALAKAGQDFSAYKQANPSEQLKMMQLQQPSQLASIPQQDLMAILKNLGGY